MPVETKIGLRPQQQPVRMSELAHRVINRAWLVCSYDGKISNLFNPRKWKEVLGHPLVQEELRALKEGRRHRNELRQQYHARNSGTRNKKPTLY